MHKYFVVSCEQATKSTLLLTLRKDPDDNRPLSFHSGQYAAINTRHGRPGVARCFSIVSSPTEEDMLQFSMRIAGRFTRKLTQLQPGDEIDVRGPFGGFVLDPARDQHAVLLAGGIGITPFISMLRYAGAVKLPTRLSLFYGVANQDDVPFLDEIKHLAQSNPRLDVTIVVGKGETNLLAPLHTATGFVTTDLVSQRIDADEQPTYFLCGSPPFMNSLLGSLKKQGVPQARLVTEAFSQGSHRQTGKVASWPQNMYILSGAGLALGTLVLAVVDIFNTLPSFDFTSSDSLNEPLSSGNLRDKELDELIAGYGADLQGQDSPAVTSAKAAASASASQSTPSSSSVPSSNSGSSSTTTTPTTTVPAPAPTPVCTTSQSGVTTCN